MRAIGTCERAIEMMCSYANKREAFGSKLADKQFIQDFIAKSRMETEQARLLTLKAAWLMDTQGKREARREISMIKVVAANVVMDVLDRAIQVHGSLGMSDDTPLAAMWRYSRMLKVADGPDEVHKMVIARRELNRCSIDERSAPNDRARPQPRRSIGLVGGLGQADDVLAELLEAVLGLAVLTLGVTGVDALEDYRQLPVAERDEVVDPAQVPAGILRVPAP